MESDNGRVGGYRKCAPTGEFNFFDCTLLAGFYGYIFKLNLLRMRQAFGPKV